MKIKRLNKEVFFNNGVNIGIGHREITAFKVKSGLNKRKRVRLCMHNDIKDKLHEMFIVHTRDAYIRPHKHLKKAESLHVIEGRADLVLFDERGNIINVIHLGDYSSGCKFYYRIGAPVFHMLLIKSRFIVFHETTSGPFKKSATIMAKWSPDEKNTRKIKEFMSRFFRKAEFSRVHNKNNE